MKLELGKKYRLLDGYFYGPDFVGKEVIIKVSDINAYYIGMNHGLLCCGGVYDDHTHVDDDHWCLHFVNLDKILEEI